MCTAFDAISSNIDEILSINPSANVFVFGDFNICHKDVLTFPTWISVGDSHGPGLYYLFIYSGASICLSVAFPPLRNSDHVVGSVSIYCLFRLKRDTLFHCTTYGYYCADWDSLHDHLRDVLWEDILKLSASAAVTEFCEWVCIPHRKYQVKPHSTSCFSNACVAAIAHRNHFFQF